MTVAGGRILLITADLMFGSKVEAIIREAGFDPAVVDVVPRAQSDDALWVADLAQGDFTPEELAGHGVPVLAFYSHVDAEIRRRAVAAGLELVVPRSRMLRDGVALIRQQARATG